MQGERVQRHIDRLLDQLDEALEASDWPTIRRLASDVLRLDPDDRDAAAFLQAAERDTVGDEGTVDAPSTGQARTRAPVDHPTSFANGRYEVKKFLGEGGKKRVYLAHDTTLDRDVAFALIKSEGLTDSDRTRITREAQAMGRLGDHPNIMPIHDLGTESGQPYMVLPVMPGDVEGLIADSEDNRLPLEQALAISKSVCRGLEFAHEQGFIHRDLKPGNVMLTADPSPGSGLASARIGDFGLAVALDVSRLTQEGMMVGTVAYMPPEQATGGEVTPRSDLYSLGAMIYEMVTGRPPFMGDDQVAIISQHINTPPVAPTWHNPQCPAPLDSLINRLLAKNPAERPGSASDVLAALDAIDLATIPSPLAGEGEGEGDRAGSLDSMAGGVFVGRHREVDRLKAALEDALSGRGRLVTLVGEPGIGKTRTSAELATYAGLRSAQTLWGRCYEGGGAPPYWPWVQAIRTYVRERDPEKLRSEMGSGASVIAEVVSDVRERLPDVESPPALDDPEAARFRLFDSITAFLKTASLAQPLVLVLDDLHWADGPSLMLLEFVAGELANSRLLLLGTYRDVELNRRHPLTRTLAELNRSASGGFERVLLRGLSSTDVGRFIEIAAGVAPRPALVEAVHTQTEGNPFFVTEVVRLLVQEGALTQENLSKRQRWSVRIPEGAREVIGRRLDRLSERSNDVLTTVAVIGREFELTALAKLYSDEGLSAEERLSEDRLLEAIEEAMDARVVDELTDQVGRYQFTHALFEQTLAEEVTITRRVRLHARIAQALEELYGDDADDHASELVPHFDQAQTVLGTEKLVHYSLAAGEGALSSLAFEEAQSHFETARTALAEGSENVEMARALFGLSQTVSWTSGVSINQQALDYNRRAFDIYLKLGDTASAIRAGQQEQTLGGTKGALDLHERALELTQPDSLDQGWVLARYGVALHSEADRFDDAIVALNRALEIARSHGDLRLEARTAVHITQRLVLEGRLEDAAREGRRAVELALEARDPVNYGRLFSHLIPVPVALGDTAWAEELVGVCRRATEASGHRPMIAGSLTLEMGLAVRSGRWQAARDIAPQVEQLQVRGRNGVAETLLSAIDLQVGAAGDAAERIGAQISSAPRGGAGWFGLHVPRLGLLSHQLTGSPAVVDVLEFVTQLEHLSSPFPAWQRSMKSVRAMAAVIERDLETAESLYAELADRSGGMDPFTWVATGRVQGLLASTLGRQSESETHFQNAVDFCRKADYRPELAWACSDYSELLLDRNEPGDREKLVELQDEAIAIAQELGMKPLLERVLAQREILKA